MSKNIGISVAIIITVIAYLANMFLSSQDFNVGSSTLALILGAVIAITYQTQKMEADG